MNRDQYSQCDCCGERRPHWHMAWINAHGIETWACAACRDWDLEEPEPDYYDTQYQQWCDDRMADRLDGYDKSIGD